MRDPVIKIKIFFGAAVVLCRSLQPKKLLKAPDFNFYAHKASSKAEE